MADGAPDLDKVICHFRDLNEGFPVERFKADYVIAWMLANYPPAPVSVRERAEPVGFVGRNKETGKFASWLYPEAPWLTDDKYEVLSAYITPPAPVVPDGLK